MQWFVQYPQRRVPKLRNKIDINLMEQLYIISSQIRLHVWARGRIHGKHTFAQFLCSGFHIWHEKCSDQ